MLSEVLVLMMPPQLLLSKLLLTYLLHLLDLLVLDLLNWLVLLKPLMLLLPRW